MDTPTQPSFIPKKPITANSSLRGGSAALGMFMFFVAVLIFVISLVAAGGAFAYKGILTKSIADKSASLQKAEAAFDPATIQQLTRTDSRINQTEALFQKHTAPLGVFNLLAQQTLPNVQLTQFDYELQDDGSVKLTLSGVADSFATVALQSDQFGSINQVLKDVAFSGVTVGSDNKVSFSIAATVDPSVINYAKTLSGASTTATPPATQTGTSTPTTPAPPQPTL